MRSVVELGAVMTNGSELIPEDFKFNSIAKNHNLIANNMSLKEITGQIINSYLDKYENNVLEVAKRLDIGKSTIYRYIKEMEDLRK